MGGYLLLDWHTHDRGGPNDNTKLIAAAQNGIVTWPDNNAPHHWGEPELGYYVMTDSFVIRKQLDARRRGHRCNPLRYHQSSFTWKDEYEALCREYTAMRRKVRERHPSASSLLRRSPSGDRPALERPVSAGK
jgi:hypothetical protein